MALNPLLQGLVANANTAKATTQINNQVKAKNALGGLKKTVKETMPKARAKALLPQLTKVADTTGKIGQANVQTQATDLLGGMLDTATKPYIQNKDNAVQSLKMDIDAGMPIEEVTNLYPDIAPNVAQSLYLDIQAGMPVEEARNLYPEVYNLPTPGKSSYTGPNTSVKGSFGQDDGGYIRNIPRFEQTKQDLGGTNAEYFGGFGKNLLKSTANLGIDVTNAATNLLELNKTNTALGLGKVVLGAIANTVGADKFLKDSGVEFLQQSDESADALGQMLKERYGSMENISRTAYEDPTGFLSDAMTIIGAGGSALKAGTMGSKAGILGKVGSVADDMIKVGALDPANKVMQANAYVGKKILQTPGKVKNVLSNVGPKVTVDDASNIVGKIVQGKTKDIQPALKTLKEIDTKGVTSYKDLSNVLSEKGKNYMDLVDEALSQDSRVFKPNDAVITTKVGETIVKQEPIKKGITQLEELYKSIDDPEALAKITEVRNKFNNNGLSVKEMNDIARQYNSEFGKKAFGKTGDPLTSVNSQAYENNRKAMKDFIRDQLPDNTTKDLDMQYSNLINTKTLVDNMTEKVNSLSQKIQKRGMVEKFARYVGRGIDFATAGGLRGLLTSFLPSNIGNKVMNSLDLQESLQSNLKKLDTIIKKIDDGTLKDADIKTLIPKTPNGTNNINLSSPSIQQSKQVKNPLSIKKSDAISSSPIVSNSTPSLPGGVKNVLAPKKAPIKMNNPLAIKKPIQSETIASKSDLMKKDTVSLIKDRLSDRKNSNESKKYYKLDGERAILMKEEATLNGLDRKFKQKEIDKISEKMSSLMEASKKRADSTPTPVSKNPLKNLGKEAPTTQEIDLMSSELSQRFKMNKELVKKWIEKEKPDFREIAGKIGKRDSEYLQGIQEKIFLQLDTPKTVSKNPLKNLGKKTSKSDGMFDYKFGKYIEGKELPTNNKEYKQVFTPEKVIDEKTTKLATIKILDKNGKLVDEFAFPFSPRSQQAIEHMADAIIYDDTIKRALRNEKYLNPKEVGNFGKMISAKGIPTNSPTPVSKNPLKNLGKEAPTKDLKPLYEEARKYKSAEEFVSPSSEQMHYWANNDQKGMKKYFDTRDSVQQIEIDKIKKKILKIKKYADTVEQLKDIKKEVNPEIYKDIEKSFNNIIENQVKKNIKGNDNWKEAMRRIREEANTKKNILNTKK